MVKPALISLGHRSSRRIVHLAPARQPAAFGKGIVVMSWLNALAASCVLAAQITTAIAADIPKGYPPEPLPLPRVRSVDFNSGWYVRGDIGYGWGRLNDVQS